MAVLSSHGFHLSFFKEQPGPVPELIRQLPLWYNLAGGPVFLVAPGWRHWFVNCPMRTFLALSSVLKCIGH